MSSTLSSTSSASASATATASPDTPSSSHDLNPAISFIIGTAIILGASVMNAAGLNFVKLDMVRTMALPKSQRRREFLRPLWLIGMTLYIASQLIGSTLALNYLRAGVIGIVAFGSINKGLVTNIDLNLLIELWSRVGWLCYFIILGFLPIFIVYIGASQLETVVFDRMDILGDPLVTPKPTSRSSGGWRQANGGTVGLGWWETVKVKWQSWMHWTRGWIENWSVDKSDKTLTWTLGICWACCGGALAGGTLVFAKASVKLVSGSLSHKNTGDQFGHPAAIFTFIFMGVTAILQILCLNRALRAYDSTLVVPVFYGVYTASGFLDSLIFNDEVDKYETWTLFLIFASIMVLIAGVVLLTLKKPEPTTSSGAATGIANGGGRTSRRTGTPKHTGEDDEIALTEQGENHKGQGHSWQVGDETDSEDEDVRNSRLGARPMHAESSQRRTLPDDGPVEARGLISSRGDDGDEEFGSFTGHTPGKDR
ncbi:hypothetical protein FRC17_010707 [Serendipita sp. 399]|nr:hypothetical protein FRC17_010707 [Serendipita sp. 399]